MHGTAASQQPLSFNKAAGSLLLICVFGGLYLVVCLLCQLALSIQVPLEEADYRYSSWMVVPPMLGGLTSMWTFIASISCTWALFLPQKAHISVIGLFVAALLASVGTQTVSLRSALLHGEAKIGCYNYSGKACLEMLGLPAAAAPYDLDEIPSPQLRSMPIMFDAVVRAPFDLARAEEIRAIVDSQRADLSAHQVGRPVTGQ